MREKKEAPAFALWLPSFKYHISVLIRAQALLYNVVIDSIQCSKEGKNIRGILSDVNVFIDNQSVVMLLNGVQFCAID